MPTHALTLHRPWAGLIVHGPKRTENRSWTPPNTPVEIGLHAGRTLDQPMLTRLTEELGPVDEVVLEEGLVGTARITSVHPAARCPGGLSCHYWGVSSGWHWMLDHVRALSRPVPAVGRQRLWRLSPSQSRALAAARPVPALPR